MTNKSSQKQKRPRKFRIMLDSAFANLSFFPKLKKRAKLYHGVYDLKLSRQASDEDIYKKAYENNCFMLTVNFKDFKKLLRKDGPGILGVESQLTTAEMDCVVAEFLRGKDPADLIEKATKIP